MVVAGTNGRGRWIGLVITDGSYGGDGKRAPYSQTPQLSTTIIFQGCQGEYI